MLSSQLKLGKERHDYVLQTYVLREASKIRSAKSCYDIDLIKQHHRFLWNDRDAGAANESSKVSLAIRYYNKLFKEYCIADLSRYKENKLALRWRTKAEVISGKGQFQCGDRKCIQTENLKTWEVNFAYREHNEQKNTLVKIRLCSEHSAQLNYRSKKREIKRLKRNISQAKRKHLEKVTCSEKNIEENDNLHESTATEENAGGNKSSMINNEGESIWSTKVDVECEQASREADFENYLEELLM